MSHSMDSTTEWAFARFALCALGPFYVWIIFDPANRGWKHLFKTTSERVTFAKRDSAGRELQTVLLDGDGELFRETQTRNAQMRAGEAQTELLAWIRTHMPDLTTPQCARVMDHVLGESELDAHELCGHLDYFAWAVAKHCEEEGFPVEFEVPEMPIIAASPSQATNQAIEAIRERRATGFRHAIPSDFDEFDDDDDDQAASEDLLLLQADMDGATNEQACQDVSSHYVLYEDDD